MTFVTDCYSYGLNVDRIRKIDIRKTAALVFFDDNEQEIFGSGSPVYKELQAFLDRQDSASHHIVPAAPGFTLLTFLAPDDDADPDSFDIKGGLSPSAVIAWHIYDGEPFGNQQAIAIDGNSTFCQQDPFGTSGVLAPDGVVFAVDGCRYASLDEWIEAVRASWKESRVQARRAGIQIVHSKD